MFSNDETISLSVEACCRPDHSERCSIIQRCLVLFSCLCFLTVSSAKDNKPMVGNAVCVCVCVCVLCW